MNADELSVPIRLRIDRSGFIADLRQLAVELNEFADKLEAEGDTAE